MNKEPFGFKGVTIPLKGGAEGLSAGPGIVSSTFFTSTL